MNRFLGQVFSLLIAVAFLFGSVNQSTVYASDLGTSEISESAENPVKPEPSEDGGTSETPEITEIDKLFSDAFNSVKRVIVIGTENGVKPFYFKCEDSLEPGISENKDVVQGVEKGLQIAIYEARTLVDKLPESIVEYKNAFSSILDNYQHPIFEAIANILDTNKDNPIQSDVILGRIIIKDLEPQYKASFSEALDKIQTKLFMSAMELVSVVESTKKEVDLKAAEKAVAELKTIPEEFSSEDINNFVNGLDNKLDDLRKIMNIYNVTSILKIINMQSAVVTPDNMVIDLQGAIPEGYSLYCTFQWINTLYNNKPTVQALEASYLKTKIVGDGSTSTVSLPLLYNKDIMTSLPVQSNYLFYFVNNSTKKVEYISKNPIRLNLGLKSTVVERTPDEESLSESTMKIDSSAAYTGYITHEVIGKSKSRQVSHNVLINKGDTPSIIITKIKISLDEFSSTYLPNTQCSVEGDELTIKSWESLNITQKIH
ncbi:hypothetical protein [Clostridium sp.]|uniref:hypothetical protein n=1 Tax=Clostridium sp. TaxID=1506 RepID=UPI002FCC6182